MKRDMNLVRSILLALEEHEHGHAPDELKIEGFSEEQIGFHVHLMGQAGLLNVADATDLGSPSPVGIPPWMTWEGYEFLEMAREPLRWKRAIEKVTSTGVRHDHRHPEDCLGESREASLGALLKKGSLCSFSFAPVGLDAVSGPGTHR